MKMTTIRRGNLPTIRPSIRLDTDELCHLEIPATYHKVNTRSTSLVPGRFVATSKKLRFLSVSGGTEIGWNSVMRVQLQSGGIYLELSRKTGNGFCSVPDPLLVEATLDTLTRMAKRQLVGLNADATSRHIPQDVRNAAWQCDQEGVSNVVSVALGPTWSSITSFLTVRVAQVPSVMCTFCAETAI